MKKLIAILLSLCMVMGILLLASCNKGGNGGETTGTEAAGTQAQTPAESDKATDAATDAATEPSETEPSETEPAGTGFDVTTPYDGIHMAFDWYLSGNGTDGYSIKTAYDLAGLAYLTNLVANGKSVYYDDAGIGIVDTDGDGDLTDEEGYNEFNVIKGNNFNGNKVLLDADIDLNGQEWLPIGMSASFNGNFDGQGHTVKNFKVTGSKAAHLGVQYGSFYGLFSVINSGSVTRVTVENEEIIIDVPETHQQSPVFAGFIVGAFASNDVTVTATDCRVYDSKITFVKGGSVNTLGYITARIYNATSSVENCTVYNVTVEGDKTQFSLSDGKMATILPSGKNYEDVVKNCEEAARDPRG